MRALIQAAVAWAEADSVQRDRLVEALRVGLADQRARAEFHDRRTKGPSAVAHAGQRDAALHVAEVYAAGVALLEVAASPEAVSVIRNVADDLARHAADGALGALYAARAYIDGLIAEVEREAEVLHGTAGRDR